MAGLGPGGVAGEEAAEGGGAVALQPRPEQLHPFIAGPGPVGGELLDDLLHVARGRHRGRGGRRRRRLEERS